MIPHAIVENLASWMIQVCLLAMAGLLLPLVFRIRHPKSQLAYCHIVLGGCLLLPLIQPWQDSLVLLTARTSSIPYTTSLSWTWGELLFGVFVAGILGKLCRLGVGLWQLRRYRRMSTPLTRIPEAVREARMLAGADARFFISRSVKTPATMGWVDPIVLVPESFLSLDAEAQRGIACHELLHVRRRDWLATVAEEFVGALFWFSPPVWWLLGQARLCREQLVDAEVVRRISPGPYIEALLSIAVVQEKRWALPAAPFLTKADLPRRMRSLLGDTRCSAGRLFFSYGLSACLLVSAVWGASLAFPLKGQAHTVIAEAPKIRPPSVLIARQRIELAAAGARGEFNVPVPFAPENVAGVAYVVHVTAPDAFPRQGPEAGPPPPPPPPPPMPGRGPLFAFLATQGIHVPRLGERTTPQEIQRLQEAIGDRATIEIDQTEDGAVRRITVLARRSDNETSPSSFHLSVDPAGPVPAGVPDVASGID